MHSSWTYRNAVALAMACVAATGALAQGYGTVAPYAVQLQALKGQTSTDVYLTFSSSDPARYPVPAALKKLQVKIRNAAGDVVYLHNEKALALTGSQLVSSVPGVNQHNRVEVQAHIKTAQTRNEEIVRGEVVAQLRPDLQVLNVAAPAEARTSQPFQVEAVIQETNLEVGAVCEVSLYKGTALFGTVPGVSVPAGGTASVVFQGVSHPTTGTQGFSVVIGHAQPAEYSTGNNSRDFAVTFVNPVITQAMNYGLYYHGYRNYDYHYEYTYGGHSDVYQDTAPHMESFQYWAYASNPATLPQGTIQSLALKVETEDGVFRQLNAADLTLTYTYTDYNGYTYNQYSFTVPGSKLQGYVYDYAYYGYTEVGIGLYQWASNRVYTYSYDGQVSYQYTESDPENWFVNADEELKVATLLSYGNTSFGGGASLAIAPYQNYSYAYSGSYWDWYWGTVTYNQVQTYDYTSNYGYGTTDPAVLPKPAVAAAVPARFGLAPNYPNPFNPSTTISYVLPEASPVRLTVYSAVGQEVRTLVAQAQPAGQYQVEWDGRDASARGVASGIYLCRLEAGGYSAVQKMLLTR